MNSFKCNILHATTRIIAVLLSLVTCPPLQVVLCTVEASKSFLEDILKTTPFCLGMDGHLRNFLFLYSKESS